MILPYIFSFAGELDVSSYSSIEKFISSIPAELKDIDILVNNAGLAKGVPTADKNVVVYIIQIKSSHLH